jgi:Reverse transcriptase (RNA-dependent DNA polymerase)
LDWRSGNTTPNFKRGSKTVVESNRPISLTCVVCKMLESIIRDNLDKHMKDNNVLSDRQYGFIKGRSMVTQRMKMLDSWTDYLENSGQLDIIYTDLEKAFDEVPHRSLLNKLKLY